VRSSTDAGFRAGGGVLLRRGENTLDWNTLTDSERALVDAMCYEGIAERVTSTPAQVSEAKVVATPSRSVAKASPPLPSALSGAEAPRPKLRARKPRRAS
jgi:hypothetical protein